MNNNSRTYNTIVNFIANVLYQIFILIMTFLSRRVFIKSLGVDYLGIGGLFSNLLQILALAELGVGSAISFCMYKEIAVGNKKKLKELNTYFKKIYNRIAMIVLTLGLAFLPFLKYIINVENEIENVEIYYLIFLLNTVFSYFFAYKTTIVSVDQNGYKLKKVDVCTNIISYLLQIFVLLYWKNYLIYLVVQVLSTLLSNYIKSKMAEKWYPFIKDEGELEESEKNEVWKNIKSMIFYKFGGVILNGTDNILTSIMVSTTMVGVYSNYTMIYNKIMSFIDLIYSSIQPSLGNLNVSSDTEKKYKTYKMINFISYWLITIATVGIFYIAEDVVIAMSGSTNYILDKCILLIGTINFYVKGNMTTNTTYRETTGIFRITKYSMLVCCILNLVLSVILGTNYGLFGILLATVIARLCTNFWYEPFLLYRKIFCHSPIIYFKEYFFRLFVCILIMVTLSPIISLITVNSLYIRIIIKTFICFIFTNIILFVVFIKKEETSFIINKIKEIWINLVSLIARKLTINTKKD